MDQSGARAIMPAVGKRNRRSQRSESQRSLLDAIADGELDDHLTAVADAIHVRQRLLHTVRSATALATLCVGDSVRINHAVSPRYLIGLEGTVIDIDEQAATIRLRRPVGRFHSGQVRCPPLALEQARRGRLVRCLNELATRL
jgi:hypothetical protein